MHFITLPPTPATWAERLILACEIGNSNHGVPSLCLRFLFY